MISARSNKGFTLIELLVVISLIGILSTLVLANLNSARERSRDTQRKSDLRNIQTALRLYYNDRGFYPCHNATNYLIKGCGTGAQNCASVPACPWGSEWKDGNTVYMSALPGDPLSSQTYRYTQIDSDNYTIEACLENKSDDKGVSAGEDSSWCPSGWEYVAKP